MSGGIDLTQLQAPLVVEALNYEDILAALKADLVARMPVESQAEVEATLALESEPLTKLLEAAAYRELLIRQRINDAAHAVMLAYARNSDLDQLGANLNVQRLVIDPGDSLAVPPVPPTLETDSAFRARIQIALEGITTAGSIGSYQFHGLSADGDVRDIQPVSPAPGEVTVYVLSHSGDGEPDSALLLKVAEALNADDVRPLTDSVTVEPVTIVPYSIEAELTVYPGPDGEVVRQAALAAVGRYIDSVRKIGYDITVSGLYAALHQAGVHSVALISPEGTVSIGDGEAGHCTAVSVVVSGEADV